MAKFPRLLTDDGDMSYAVFSGSSVFFAFSVTISYVANILASGTWFEPGAAGGGEGRTLQLVEFGGWHVPA